MQHVSVPGEWLMTWKGRKEKRIHYNISNNQEDDQFK